MSTLHVSKFVESEHAPILVLLHGWGSSSKIWNSYIETFKREFQVWCIDLPGHGKSQALNWDTSIEQGLDLLSNVLPQSSSIVGWSLGGLFAQLFLKYYPQRVQNLMLVASTPKFTASKNWPHGMPVEIFNKFSQGFITSPQKSLKQFIALQALHGLNAKQVMQQLDQSATVQYLQEIEWGLHWLAEIDLRASELTKNFNIHILQGESDQVLSVKATENTTRIWENVSLYKITNAGHAPFLSHPNIFVEQVQLMMQTGH